MGILKHTPLAQSVGKGDVDVITLLEVSEADLALGSVGCFLFSQRTSRKMILAIITPAHLA